MPSHSPPNTAETVKRFKQASQTFRKEVRKDPQKAKDFLIRAGIAVRSRAAPSGVKLARRFG